VNARTRAGSATPRIRNIENAERRQRAYYRANKKKITAGKRHRRATDPKYRSLVQARNRKRWRGYELKYKYGLSLEGYDKISRRQKGACAICKARGRLCVDHCHRTKVVGGLLCQSCNSGLGFFGDSPATMLTGATYLLQARPEALSGAELARTRRALRRFMNVLENVVAARRRTKTTGQKREGSPVLKMATGRLRAPARWSRPSPPARSGSARTARAGASPCARAGARRRGRRPASGASNVRRVLAGPPLMTQSDASRGSSLPYFSSPNLVQ
jgi:hypothetical protein